MITKTPRRQIRFAVDGEFLRCIKDVKTSSM